jgi:galactokinase
MPKTAMKTKAQNSAIFGLGARLKCSHEDLRELAFDVTNGRTDQISELTFDEANGMISRLGGRPFVKNPQFDSKRAEQHRKQEAGVETIATGTHKDFMRSLARKRGMDAAGLGDLSAKVNKGLREPRTSKEVNRVVEAIKAMNRRDRTFNAFKKDEKEAA